MPKRRREGSLESEVDQLDALVDQRRSALAKVIEETSNPIASTRRQITTLELAEQGLDDAVVSISEVNSTETEISNGEGMLEDLRQQLVARRIDAENRLRAFSDICSDIVKAVLESSVSASAEL